MQKIHSMGYGVLLYVVEMDFLGNFLENSGCVCMFNTTLTEAKLLSDSFPPSGHEKSTKSAARDRASCIPS